ncbi:CHAD domain-containing protein [Streptomyces abyssomicinicus]|uniref:CHAD domain-containing protein n=1 Tax=Streptomyces abyssomicinicus TaxID=574929 RepID=UPI001FEAC7E4|nr:CHAD domain-containing protein [Streptomyces abyssomicinicus]
MAQQHPDVQHPAGAAPALTAYLRAQATDFLRAQTGSAGGGPAQGGDSAPALRRAARRIGATLHTFHAAFDPAWSAGLRRELAWFSGALAQERLHAATLRRLQAALQEPPGDLGAARAAALLERRLTLARGRAHSAVLEALGSARFHALADAVALLGGEVPLRGDAAACAVLREQAGTAEVRLADAVAALPAGPGPDADPATDPDPGPYGDALPYGDAGPCQGRPGDGDGDPAWHQVRLLLRLHRYAVEALGGPVPPRLVAAARALDRHRDAAEAASVAAAAARTPRIAPATAYALGNLHAHQRHEVLAARHAFHRTWQSLPRPRNTVTVP